VPTLALFKHSCQSTETEVKERKDRVDDAMHATRAAVEEGILPGGGVALLRSVAALKRIKTDNEDQKHGVEIVRKAIQSPARQIAINAGADGSVVVGKIMDKDRRQPRRAPAQAPAAEEVKIITPAHARRCAAALYSTLSGHEGRIEEYAKRGLTSYSFTSATLRCGWSLKS
jgi:chaperonin GroEL